MANDDWRIRIDVEEERTPQACSNGSGRPRLRGPRARTRPRVPPARSLARRRDGLRLRPDASRGRERAAVVEAELSAHGIEAKTSRVEHWIDAEDRWDDEPPGETWEEEELDRGYAPWEVRVECASREEARKLAEQLEAEGYQPQRSFHYLVVGTATREDADALAERLHGDVEAGGEVVWETTPQSPFAIFGGLAHVIGYPCNAPLAQGNQQSAAHLLV